MDKLKNKIEKYINKTGVLTTPAYFIKNLFIDIINVINKVDLKFITVNKLINNCDTKLNNVVNNYKYFSVFNATLPTSMIIKGVHGHLYLNDNNEFVDSGLVNRTDIYFFGDWLEGSINLDADIVTFTNVKEIPSYKFEYGDIKQVSLDSVEIINDHAFINAGINEITNCNNLKFIGSFAFSGNNLKELGTELSNVEIIDRYAFDDNPDIKIDINYLTNLKIFTISQYVGSDVIDLRKLQKLEQLEPENDFTYILDENQLGSIKIYEYNEDNGYYYSFRLKNDENSEELSVSIKNELCKDNLCYQYGLKFDTVYLYDVVFKDSDIRANTLHIMNDNIIYNKNFNGYGDNFIIKNITNWAHGELDIRDANISDLITYYKIDRYNNPAEFSFTDKYGYDLEDITRIGKNTFSWGRFTNLILPINLEYIDEYAFAYSIINNIKFNKNLKRINSRAFEDATIKEIKLNYGIEYIGDAAFNRPGGSNHDYVYLPGSLKYIGFSAFNPCNDIHVDAHFEADMYSESIIPENKLGAFYLGKVFVNYYRAEDESNIVLNIKEGITKTAYDIEYGDIKEVTYPDSIEYIYKIRCYETYYSNVLTKITIGKNIKFISELGELPNLSEITVKSMYAPTIEKISENIGSNVEGNKKIIVPTGAVGYDKYNWNSLIAKGFTIEYSDELAAELNNSN
jgi:hypothetical protein